MDTAKLSSNSRKLKFGNDGAAPTQIGSGMAFPVADLIQSFKPEVWEDFTEEWAYSQEKKYKEIIRYTGAGDMGLDILCFHTAKQFDGPWDNVQCKRYACELKPSQIWVELGKIVYYSFNGEYPPPKNYYFAASKGLGLKLKKLLTKPLVDMADEYVLGLIGHSMHLCLEDQSYAGNPIYNSFFSKRRFPSARFSSIDRMWAFSCVCRSND